MKWCHYCKQPKDITEFAFRDKIKGTRHNRCKQCQKAYCKAHYQQNREKHNQRRYINQKRYRADRRLRIIHYLQTHPCVDCGEADILVLDFDHLRNKEHNIADMIRHCKRWPDILKEIQKCEVRCANCHRRRTAKEQRSYKYMYNLGVVQLEERRVWDAEAGGS